MDSKQMSSTNPRTLAFHLVECQKKHKEAHGDFTLLMSSISTACKFISSKVRKAGMANLYGASENINSTGDIQKKLDILANEAFINALKNSQTVSIIISEEEEQPIYCENDGKYIVAMDPLDGSSNIDANVTIGTIFGIWKRRAEVAQKDDLLQSGDSLIAAGYCVYGPSTQLVICIDKNVNGYTLDPSLGEFILTHPDLRIPQQNAIYSINEGNSAYWEKPVFDYVQSKKNPPQGKKVYSLRYVGSMVADVHRTLLYGGIFMYPTDSKTPLGKLRILYECFPLAFVIESAGGKATTGRQRILDLQPAEIHQRDGIILGSLKDVEDVESFFRAD